MTRVDINGKWYILTAVVQSSSVSESVRATTPTYIYIINESNSKVEAIVADYSYEHANSMAYDGKYIYIHRGSQKEKTDEGTENVVEDGRLLVLDKKYVSDAIARGGKITSNFTKKYLIYGESLTGRVSLASMVYDKSRGKLYGSNKSNFYELSISGSGSNAKLNITRMFKQYHSSNHYKKENGKTIYAMTNAGAAIYNDYLFLGRYYPNGYAGRGTNKNAIDVFRISRDSSGYIRTQNYFATYVLNDSVMSKGEIEDLEVVDSKTLAIHYNDGSINKVYFLNLERLNYSKVKVFKNGRVVAKNTLSATVYDSNNKKIGTYKPNSNGNLVIRNLPAGRYKAVITGLSSSKKKSWASSIGKTVEFDVGFFYPYKMIRFDI